MTKRIILTNKDTGQVLPEATETGSNLTNDFWVKFDGTELANSFARSEWDAEYPEPPVVYRNGDVLRHKDRGDIKVVYVFKGGSWWELSADGSTREMTGSVPSAINKPDWELV